MLEFINLTTIPVFLLIFVRMLSFLVVMPLFSYRTVPVLFKVGFSFFLALSVFYTIDETTTSIINELYVLLLAKEALIGLLIGFIAYLVLSAVQIAGGFIDFQMGFAIANIVDPQTGAQSPIIGQYFYIFALLFLVATNAHHLLIDGIYYSYSFIGFYDMVPIGDESFPIFILQSFAYMFLLAFQMAIPIVGALFLVDVALGMIARTVPQVNVFVVGLPLKIFVSFVAILIFLSLYVAISRSLFELMFQAMQHLMMLFGGA